MAIKHQQQQFINEYLITGNATQAAITAGYSAKTAQVQSSRLLKQPAIKQAIEQAQSQTREYAKVELNDLITELEAARVEALAQGQCSAAVSATMGKAKLLGFDKPDSNIVQVSVKNGLEGFYGQGYTVNENELDARIKELTQKLGY